MSWQTMAERRGVLASVRVVDDVSITGSIRPALDLVVTSPDVIPVEGEFRPTAAGSWSAPSVAKRAVIRGFDLAVAVPATLILFPVMALIAILVRLTSRGPVVYSAPRITRHGAEFQMHKFRSMHRRGDEILAEYFASHPDSAELYHRDRKLRDDPRLTRFGRLIRRTSLDELPQLFNVLRGEMSIVGPRPMMSDEVVRFGPEFVTVVRVKAGITGLWQVSGRSLVDFEDRVTLDVQYVRSRSLTGDVSILWRTIGQLVSGCPGAY